MNIVRYDIVGSIDIKLVKRPTNTAAGVHNWHILANGSPADGFPGPVVRFLGTDAMQAHERYLAAVAAGWAVYRAHPL